MRNNNIARTRYEHQKCAERNLMIQQNIRFALLNNRRETSIDKLWESMKDIGANRAVIERYYMMIVRDVDKGVRRYE